MGGFLREGDCSRGASNSRIYGMIARDVGSNKKGGQIKKGAHDHATNGQNATESESIPNQIHTEFGWELKIIDLGCI